MLDEEIPILTGEEIIEEYNKKFNELHTKISVIHKKCDYCNGKGIYHSLSFDSYVKCDLCNGLGYIRTSNYG